MKELGNYGQSEKNDIGHEIEISSSGSREVPVYGEDLWHSLVISDESALDGEVGKRLNQMVPIPVSVT